DVVRAKDLQTKGSISAIYHRSNNLVKVLLGPGRSLGYALYAVTVLDAASKLALAQTASILILSTLEQNAATGTPKEMASGLLLLAASLVIVQLLKYFVAGHSGSWFMRRAKYAVTKKDDITPGKKAELTTMEVSTLMQDLYSVKTIFLDHKFELISNIIVEFSGILAIGLFSARLMYVALALYGCGKALSLIDDLMIIHEQHRMADIVRRNASSSNAAAPAEGETEKDLRFFHNVTGGRHMVVKTVGNIYSYCSPVVFLYAAMNFGSLQAQKTDGAITKQELLQSSIYFFLVAITQLKGHGRMTKFLSQMGHCERVLEFHDNNHQLFDFFKTNESAKIPFSKTKDSDRWTWTHSEKTALLLTGILFAAIGAFSIALTQNVDLTCKPIEIMCTHVPDVGSHVSFSAPQEFNLLVGCKISLGVNEILDRCALELQGSQGEEAEEVDFDIVEEEYVSTGVNDTYSADVAGEIEKTVEEQMMAVANPQLQSDSDGSSEFLIAASFESWRGLHRFERNFQEEVAEDVEEGERRLSSGGSISGVGSTFSSTTVNTAYKTKEYTIEIIVGGGRYDGTNNEISIQLFSVDGKTSTNFLNVGKSFKKAETRSVKVADVSEIENVGKVVVTTSGKDGVKFSSILINRKAGSNTYGYALGKMDSSLKCTGSKRKKTWTCSQDVTVERFGEYGKPKEGEDGGGYVPPKPDGDNSGCPVEICNYDMDTFTPKAFGSLSDFTPLALTQLNYEFGTVWNDCAYNGPVRFAYNAVCDGGCQKRAHGFKLSPKKYFPDGDDEGCQQKNGKSYPKYCLSPQKDGKAWSLSGLKSKEIKEACQVKLGHDRGHQIPANNFDYSKSVCKQTNYMTNILPQADMMNRGAWLKTEMMGECWRQHAPLTIIGGAVFLEGSGKTVADIPEWEGDDRSDWFVETHKVKNPAYQWKLMYSAATDKQKADAIAFWMPNHESATNKKIDDYVVSIKMLEDNLAEWGSPEVFDVGGIDKEFWGYAWKDPAGCNRQ
ncbi:hypothetical protein TrRE_jg9902, partial [Triparma retinervis]